jgi:hypothetical protein
MTAGQIVMGFICWVIAVSAAVGAGAAAGSPWLGFFCLAAILIPSSIYFTSRLGWRGFFPGVLIGAAATCLVPLGIVGAICATHR